MDHVGLLGTILTNYVDDERIHINSERKPWSSAHQVSSREFYLGIQDADSNIISPP